MQYEIQFARLATTEKLPDRFLNVQLKANSDLSKSGMGEVFMLVEILTPWLPTAQIGQSILNTFTEEYYSSASTSDLVNFENALKKINQQLAKITQEGETEWLGKLNAILGVIVENKLHLAQAGKAEAYIFRDGKTNHLTEGLAQNTEPHPLKTFSNVTSGELKTNDKVLIANPETYDYLSLENLRQLITMNSPHEAVVQTARLLKKKKVNKVNILILNLLTSEELAKLPVQNENDTVYLDKPLESFWIHVIKVWQQLLYPVLKFMGKKTQTAAERSVNFTKNYLTTLNEKRKTKEPPKKRDLFEKEFIDSAADNNLLKDEEIQYSPELAVHYYNKQKEKKEKKENNFSNFLVVLWQRVRQAAKFLIDSWGNHRRRPYFYAGFAIIILLILGLTINHQKNNANKTSLNLNQAQAALKEAENASKDATTANLGGDKEKAKTLFLQAIEKAQKITDFPVVGENAKEIIKNSYAILDQMTSTTRFDSLNPILSLDEEIKSVFISSGNVYFVGKSNNIYKGLISGGEPEKVAGLPRNNGDFVFGSTIDRNFYFYTSAQKVYEFQTINNEIDLAKTNSNWETANAGAAYDSNLYLLDGIIGQIYKHPSSSDSFTAGENYVNSGSIDLKNSVSMAIDGNIYVLKSSGEVIELSRGKLQDFSLQNIPSPYSTIISPLKIYTDADTPSIYILDNSQKRILEFDKSGYFIHQYALPSNLNNISDFIVSSKSKKIWISADKNLYEIGI